ncbi:unnamed protein product [Rotaria sp. Silwood1]|nr:unnamed protein product [Rotaria sp. Silwood1]
MYSVEPIIFDFTHDTICPLTLLEYLEIDGCYMVEFLELLKYVGSNIKRMKIHINYRRDQDPESIDEKIIDNLLCGDDGQPQIPPQSSLSELVYLFNDMNRQWINSPIIIDYNFQSDPPLHEFYTYSQPSHDGKYIVEFYGTKRHIAPSNDAINIDKNMTRLKITLNDDQLLANEILTIYPKVTAINVHSQMTTITIENDSKNSLICSDIKKSIPDLSTVTILDFTTHSPTNSVYPSTTFAHCLLVTLPNVSSLHLPYNYLLQLVKSPLITQELAKQIDCLWITCYNSPPLFEDMIRILSIFSKNLRFLYFDMYIDFPYVTFYLILPLLMRGICTELMMFQVQLETQNGQQQQPSTFNEEFKIWFKECLTTLSKVNEKRSTSIEYKIKDEQFVISF